MNYEIKKGLTRIKRIIQNPHDAKFLFANKSVMPSGVLLVIHESQELGASILTLRIAEEMINQGEHVYLVSRQFGRMNERYSKIAPVQIALTSRKYREICRHLYKKGYRKALMITASTGNLVKDTKECGYEVAAMIHELDQVITMLHLEKATKEMLEYSDKVIFSTSVAKKQILNLCGYKDNEKFFIKPQGTYFRKPSENEVIQQKEKILGKFPELSGQKIIAGIGNTTERKGFDIFLQTASLLPKYEFVWAGKQENYFDEAIRKCGMPKNFKYLGSMDSYQLSGLYELTDIYLMCSRFDTLPSTIFESLLFHIPVIGAKDSGGIVDVIHSENGFLTETSEPEQFAVAIKKVLEKEFIWTEYDNSFEDYVRYVLELF